MRVIESLPKDDRGFIVLSPGGEIGGEEVDSYVDLKYFRKKFPDIYNQEIPLSKEDLEELKLDRFWKENVNKWVRDGII